VSSMNFFLPLTEETQTPISPRHTASSWGAGSRDVDLSVWISCKTLGISILGGLFRFSEEETEGFTAVVVFMSETNENSLAIVTNTEREREREREREAEAPTAIKNERERERESN
jgi:hypothetical protein